MPQHGGKREGSGRTPLPENEKKIAKTIYITPTLQNDIEQFASGNSFSEKCIDLINAQIARRKRTQDRTVKFIDLFAGLGGIRLGFENAFREKGFNPVCVFSSEIKDYAIKAYKNYFNDEEVAGDITKISATDIEDFDFLLGGFPCQPFSAAGLGLGFEDTRGTLFFDVCQIVQEHHPKVIFLENVKHLVYHDGGRTLATIVSKLEEMEYKVSFKVLNGADFGVPQNRERIIIVASLVKKFDFMTIKESPRHNLKDILDKDGDFEYLKPEEYTLLGETHRQPASGLIFAGYRNKSIRKAGVRPGTEHLSRVHKQPNRIYSVEGVHPTLPSQESSGRFFILTEDNRVRKLTLNECWRLMGFPDSYRRVSPAGQQYRQLGNSVCVKMIEAIAKEIKCQLLEIQ